VLLLLLLECRCSQPLPFAVV